MWLRILRGVAQRNRGSFALTLLSAVVGATLVASLGSLAFGISAKIAAELKSYGANILVKSSGTEKLSEADLASIKSTIFWRYNIVGVTPFLYEDAVLAGPSGATRTLVAGTWFDKEMPGTDGFRTGVRSTSPFLRVEGQWPADVESADIVLGSRVAEQLGVSVGDQVTLRLSDREGPMSVVGVMQSGGVEDEQAFVPLDFLQVATDQEDVVSQALVSAVTVPLDDFGRRDPKTMTKREYDKWYCTAYVTSVSQQVQETVKGSSVRPVWRVVEAEGKVLGQLSWLIYGLVGLSLLAASLAVSTTLMGNVMRRRSEIGVLKAIGGEPRQIAAIFLLEAGAIGLLAGVAGWFLGGLLAEYLGRVVFGSPFDYDLQLFALSVAASLLVTLVGSYLPLREALRVPAAEVMRG